VFHSVPVVQSSVGGLDWKTNARPSFSLREGSKIACAASGSSERSWGDEGFVQEKKEKKEAEEEQHEQQDTFTAAPDLPLAESLDRRDDEEDVLNLDSEPGKEQQLDVQEAPGTAGSWYGIRNFRSDTPTSLEANGEDQKGAKSDAAWEKNFFSGRKAEGHVSLELEALRSTVHRLREKEKQLESQILEYKRRAEAQASTLKDLQEKETRMAEKVLEYRESSKRLREREKTFLDREQEKDVEIMELRSCLEALELQGKHQALEISAGEKVKKELDEANARVEELQKQVHTNAEQENAKLLLMQEKVSMLETQCKEEGSKIVELRSHLEAVELQRTNQALEVSASESLKKKELDEAHATVEELKKEMQTNAEQANADLALMKQKVSMLETQCEEEGSKIVELRSHLEAAELQGMLEISASENVKKELDEAHATVEELKKEMQTNAEQANADLALMKQKVSMLETQCEELHKKDVEIIELKSCLEGLELQIVNHASEISANEKLRKELDEARGRVEELQKEVQTNAKQANIELLMMKEKVSMLETQCEELNEKDVEIMELRSHLEVVELERGNLTLEIFANEKLKKELNEARTNVEELQKEMETNAEKGNVELSVMIQKVSMLEIQCEELHEKNVEITKLKSHLKALEIQNMNQALEIFASEKLKKELDYAHARIEELQREVQTNVEQANIKLSTTKQKVSMLETQCEEEQNKITELRSCLEGLELQNKNQALEISTRLKLKEELEEAHATRVEELQKEMQTNVEQANVELSMTKHKVSMLETQCEEKGCKIEELGSHLASLELQNRNQALEISKVQELKKELEEAHVAMVEELQKEMQTNVEQANVELSMTKQKVSMLETQCQEKRCKIEELGSHLEGLELQSKNQTLEIFARQKLQKDLEEAHGTRIEELQKEMRTNVEQANAKLSMMKQKVSMLETQCEEKGSKIEELKSHIEVLELQNKNPTLEISTWQKLTKELEEAHVAVVEELQKEVVGLQHTDKELEQQKIELNERLLATENKLAHHFEMEKVNIFAWKKILRVKSSACIIMTYWELYAIKC
jgi:chromosome segregation ATPase